MAYAHQPNGPAHGPGVVMQTVGMNNSLFGCFDDCGDCVYGYFCFPCHLGSIAQRSGSGDCFLTCCISMLLQPILPLAMCYNASVYRKSLYRVGVNAPLPCLSCACFCCCLQCQVSREVNDRQAAAASMPHVGPGVGVAGQPQIIVVQAPPAQVVHR